MGDSRVSHSCTVEPENFQPAQPVQVCHPYVGHLRVVEPKRFERGQGAQVRQRGVIGPRIHKVDANRLIEYSDLFVAGPIPQPLRTSWVRGYVTSQPPDFLDRQVLAVDRYADPQTDGDDNQ